MATITISKKLIHGDDLIVIPRKEYEEMKSRLVPVVYLKGKSAKRLDKRVTEGMREYKKGNAESMEAFLKREYPGLHKTYGD